MLKAEEEETQAMEEEAKAEEAGVRGETGDPEKGRKVERMWWRLWTVEVRGEF